MARVLTDRDPADETQAIVGDPDVFSWRLDELQRAGYPLDVAVLLAENATVDLHLACGLLERGATLHEALRILS